MLKGSEVVVSEVKGYGSDGSSVFSMLLLDKGDAAPPVGEPSEFAIGKGDDEIKGTKYSCIYTEDWLVGIGKLRPKGDRGYEYVLPFGGKELHVYYRVYGSDPRNLVEAVDKIVRRTALPARQ